MDSQRRSVRLRKALDWKKFAKFVPAIIGFALPFFIHFDGLSYSGHLCLSIFLTAACLWLFEPVPLFSTAVLIFLLEIVLLSEQGLAPHFSEQDTLLPFLSYKDYLLPLANPLIVLFLGGFVLADAARKFKVDRELAKYLLKPFGTNPKFILMGIMLITAVFSAFMSNTACTAMMMAVIFPAVAVLAPNDKYRIAVLLAVPFAANIGGMATPIGTPPNAVVIGQLEAMSNIKIEFLEWVKIAGPFSLLMLLFVWLALLFMFPSKTKKIALKFPPSGKRNGKKILVYIVFASTVLLWITGKWHGIPDGVVALVPVAIFTMFKVLSPKEFNSLSWDILWLIAGGMALGNGMESTGLTTWLVNSVSWGSLPGWAVLTAFSCGTVLLSTFISNTAASNLFVPLAIGVATSIAGAGLTHVETIAAVVPLVVSVGLSASLAMALPISTPPNAIAYATGLIRAKDMSKSGVIIGIVGLVILILALPIFWSLIGAWG